MLEGIASKVRNGYRAIRHLSAKRPEDLHTETHTYIYKDFQSEHPGKQFIQNHIHTKLKTVVY